MAYNILERTKGEDAGYRILLYAVPRVLVNSYIRVAELLKLPIEAIDYCGNGQYQVLHQVRHDSVTMYIDINLTNTYVNFMENGVLLLQRNLAIGGDHLLSVLMEKEGRDGKECLDTLKMLSDEAYMDLVMPMMQRKNALSRLSFNVTRMIDFFHTTFNGKEISQIVIMGTSSNIAGIAELIKQDTGLETVHIFELEEMKKLTDSEDGVNYYLSCIGTLIAPLDLLPADYTARTKKKKDNGDLRGVQLFFVVCIVAAGTLCAYGSYQNQLRNEEVTAARLKVSRVRAGKEVFSKFQEYEEIYNNLQALKNLKIAPNANLVKFFEELEEKMPHELSISSIECNNQGVVMNITTTSYAEAAVTLAQLRTFASLESIEVSGISKSGSEDEDETVSFSIHCIYGEMPVEEETEQEAQGQ